MSVINTDGIAKNGIHLSSFNASSWQVVGTPTVTGYSITEDADCAYGDHSLKVVVESAGLLRICKYNENGIDLSGDDIFALLSKWCPIGSSAAISIWFGSDTTIGATTNSVAFTLGLTSTSAGWRKDSGWMTYTWDKSVTSSVSGALDWTRVRNIIIRMNVTAPETFKFNDFWVGKKSRSVCILTYDDNVQSSDFDMVTHAAEARALGIPVSHFVIPELVDMPGYMSKSQLLAMQDAGDNICAHTNNLYATTKPTSSEVESDIAAQVAWLKSNGFHGYEFFAWPGGAYYSDGGNYIQSARNNGIKLARTLMGIVQQASSIENTQLGVIEPMIINSQTLADGVVAVKAAIDRAIKRGATIVLYTHTISTGSATPSGYNITGSDYATILAYIAERKNAGNLECMTMQQYWNSLRTNGSIQIVFEVDS